MSWSRVHAAGADACPLTPAEEQDAVEKFDKMWPVIRHPRCLNCHGAVRPDLDERQGKHLGGRIPGPEAFRKCPDCHDLEFWDTPVSEFFFIGKSARQLCMQFKRVERSPLQFVEHVFNDRGGTPFTVVAFRGDRALNDAAKDMVEEVTGRPFEAEPPPMSHGEFLQLASDWANAVGERGWKATRREVGASARASGAAPREGWSSAAASGAAPREGGPLRALQFAGSPKAGSPGTAH